LVVAARGDVHADVVARLLRQRGHDPGFLHQEDMLRSASLTVQRDGAHWSGSLDTGTDVISLRDTRVVWWRRQVSYHAPLAPPPGGERFARASTRAAMDGLWRTLGRDPDVYWMSDPFRIKAAANKIGQLHRAIQLGFSVPRTVVTSDPGKVREFYEECSGRIVYKSVSDGIVTDIGALGPHNKSAVPFLFTSVVGEQELAGIESVRTTPCLFQEMIPKDRELRVTVFEDQVFTCALYSQDDERSRIDWRHKNAEFRYAAETLPGELAKRCVELTRGYGLNFAAFDFIVTPDGDYVFLEMNPNGQWLFAQLKVPELTMAQALTDILIRRARRQGGTAA
jgi:glutathione synthase/RimK-type ligase-like ATP-grasp enzyme